MSALAGKEEVESSTPAAAPSTSEPAASTEAASEAASEAGGEGDDAAAVEDEGSTAVFKPLVQLEEIDVVSGEEGEETVMVMRGKLYRYTETLLDKGTGKKQWIERGIGEIKLLKNTESQQQRFLMRQEKTLKIIVNTLIDPRVKMTQMASNDKTWVWSCYDFSDGEIVEEVFAFKCTSIEDAKAFKEAFDKAQGEMAKLLEGADGAPNPEADAAAEALGSLSTKA